MGAALRSENQNRALWAMVGRLVKENGLSRDDAEATLRRIVREVSGQESSRALSSEQAGRVLSELDRLLATQTISTKPFTPARPARVVRVQTGGVITPDQLRANEQLCEALGMTSPGYAAFCRRMLKVSWPQTLEQAIKVYEGLEALLRRKYTVNQLQSIAGSILVVAEVSTQDVSFARSILETTRRKKRCGAGQISILLKIGRRYGLALPASESLPTPD